MLVDRLADVFNIQAETINDETNLDLCRFIWGLMRERSCLRLYLYCCLNALPLDCSQQEEEDAWTPRGWCATKDKPPASLHPFLPSVLSPWMSVIRQGSKKKKSDLSFSFEINWKIIYFFKSTIHVCKKTKCLSDYFSFLSSQLLPHGPSIK